MKRKVGAALVVATCANVFAMDVRAAEPIMGGALEAYLTPIPLFEDWVGTFRSLGWTDLTELEQETAGAYLEYTKLLRGTPTSDIAKYIEMLIKSNINDISSTPDLIVLKHPKISNTFLEIEKSLREYEKDTVDYQCHFVGTYSDELSDLVDQFTHVGNLRDDNPYRRMYDYNFRGGPFDDGYVVANILDEDAVSKLFATSVPIPFALYAYSVLLEPEL